LIFGNSIFFINRLSAREDTGVRYTVSHLGQGGHRCPLDVQMFIDCAGPSGRAFMEFSVVMCPLRPSTIASWVQVF
jgi:hypothetical protein